MTMSKIEPVEYDETRQKSCPACNKAIPEVSEYCPFCGMKMQVAVSEPAQSEEQIENKSTLSEEKKKKKKKHNKPKCVLVIGAAILLVLLVFIIYPSNYTEGKIQVPFDSTSVIGKDADKLYKQLSKAGFKKITKREDESGWLDSGKTTRISIDNSDSFFEGNYKNIDADIVIYYSSEGRINAGQVLADWQNANCEVMQQQLVDAGFSNVSIGEETITYEREQNGFVASISIDGNVYTDGKCYLPKNTPITISCYTLKITIGNKSSKFKGRYYKDVVADLQERGFINIELRRANNLKLGILKKEGEISYFSINGSTDFKKSDSFYYYAQIVIIVNTYKDEGCDDIIIIAN